MIGWNGIIYECNYCCNAFRREDAAGITDKANPRYCSRSCYEKGAKVRLKYPEHFVGVDKFWLSYEPADQPSLVL